MKQLGMRFFPPLAIALATVSAPLQAQVRQFSTFGSWIAAVTGVGVDDFDDVTPRDTLLATPLARATTPTTYSYQAGSTGGLSVGGPGSIWLSSWDLYPIILSTFTPSTPGGTMSALSGTFGIVDENWAALAGDITISWVVAGAGSGSSTLSYDGGATMPFFGITSDSEILSFSVEAVQGGGIDKYATLETLRLGVAVPEPPAWAVTAIGLAALGLVGLGRTWRRSRRLSPVGG